MDALVLLLLDIRTQARLSVEDVHELLKNGGHFKGQLPARSTLYRKLSGVGLKNERRLVEAVIGVCVPDDRRTKALRDQANSLLRQAWSEDAEAEAPEPVMAPDDGGSMAELVRVQRELINVQAQLAAALQTAAEAEKESAQSRALVTMLLVFGALGRPEGSDTSTRTSEGPFRADSEMAQTELQAQLTTAKAERDETNRAAQRRPAETEDLLAAHAPDSAGPTDFPSSAPAGPPEWPTTRTDPVDRIALDEAPTRRTGRVAPNATAAPVEREAQHGAVSSLERQTHERVRTLEQDPELAEVMAEMVRLDPDGSRMGSVIDGAGRHLLDPVHTGRYLWSQLTKVERVGFGAAVHQRMQRELGLADGLLLDFTVAGHEVDVKFSLGNNWNFAPELQGGLCLVVRADDASGLWSIGLLRVRSELMRAGSNRDGKRGLSAQGRNAIHWIAHDLRLPDHALRRLPVDVVNAIFAKTSGQARIEELFLRAQLTPVTTADLSAVTMQADGVKRAREARRRLAEQGVLVLNGTRPLDIERALGLGLPVPAPSTWVSVRLAPAPPQQDGSPTIALNGNPWCVARPGDPKVALPAAALT
ncbi:NaeI family type II restriction endonuclease [Streptomyces sp. LUP47B]|uniref:NaeI family type II restriction endonuclease n=1 Tax=Streptomyces sp. LUP47B TaxID=1890286 RepID=UPI00159F1205|nr:NaeI family type II restriction endonuclease [Streptomyces sp. LUP47B]